MRNDNVKSLRVILRDKIAKSEAKLSNDLRKVGYGSGHIASVSFDELDRMTSIWKHKQDQLDRINNLIDPVTTSRDDLLKSWQLKTKRLCEFKKLRNKARRDKKAKRQDYKRYKERLESERKNSDPIKWALLLVDNPDIRAWLSRRLSSVVVDGSILESELISVFKSVGDSDRYYENVKSRLKIICEPSKAKLPKELIDIWTSGSISDKKSLIEEYNLTCEQITELREISKQNRLQSKIDRQ